VNDSSVGVSPKEAVGEDVEEEEEESEVEVEVEVFNMLSRVNKALLGAGCRDRMAARQAQRAKGAIPRKRGTLPDDIIPWQTSFSID